MGNEQPMIADSPPPRFGRRSPDAVVAHRRIVLAGGLIVLAGLSAMVWWTSRDVAPAAGQEAAPAGGASPLRPGAKPPLGAIPDAPRAVPAPSAPGDAVAAQACPPVAPLAPLDDSDGFVRERLTCVGALAPGWLEGPDLARRAAMLLENARTGQIARRQAAFMAPAAPFKVLENGAGVFVDPASYQRYDRATDVLTCLPPARAAALLRRFEPLLVAALDKLGAAAPYADGHIDAALAQIEATPMPPGRVALVRPGALYEYADPALQALPPLKKQLLRMGPANLARLKDYARQLRAALAAPAACPAA